MSDRRMAIEADLLAEGYDPDELTLLAVVHRRMVDLVNQAVAFELIAKNRDRPDAAKYGTHPDGTPRYAPEWYTAQGIGTHLHESLHGALRELLSCESVDEDGHRCIGSLLHTTCHWDGNGNNWERTS